MTDASADPLSLQFERTIHEPGRLVVMANLFVVEEADFVYLANRTGLTPGNLSAHIAKLESAKHVETERLPANGRRRTVYRLTEAGRAAFSAYRSRMQALLSATEG